MADGVLAVSAWDLAAIRAGRKTQHRLAIEGVPMFSVEYDRSWRPHATPPGGCLPEEWSWWEGPPHGPSLYHTARLPFANGQTLALGVEGHVVTDLTITIEKMTVERLLDIREDDAAAEGVEGDRQTEGADGEMAGGFVNYTSGGLVASARESFLSLWQGRRKEGSHANPWVMALRFEPRFHLEEVMPEGGRNDQGGTN